MRQISIRDRLPYDAAWAAACVMALFTLYDLSTGGFGYDCRAYWLAARHIDYSLGPGEPNAFLYSPAFAQVLSPFGHLPFPAFATLMSVAATAGIWWLLAPLSLRLRIPILIACSYEITSGNVFWALAISAVLGQRFAGAWVVPALTKITPCLGPVWFAARGEWRRLAIFCGCLAVVVGVSVAANTAAWVDWTSFLAHRSHGGYTGALPVPLAVRVVIAVAVTVLAARTDRVWLLPVGMAMATPVFAFAALTMLCAIPRLRAMQREAAGVS
ncbi:MAG: glycosyltransferase 87 family protein [Aeromicrobium sp.]